MNNDIKPFVEDLSKMISQGKILEAFEKYYAEDIVMQENEDAPRIGKEENRKYEEAFVNGIVEVHDMKTLGVAWGDNYSVIESYMDVTHKDWGRVARAQVAIQRWKDGKVVNEKFYYNNAK